MSADGRDAVLLEIHSESEINSEDNQTRCVNNQRVQIDDFLCRALLLHVVVHCYFVM